MFELGLIGLIGYVKSKPLGPGQIISIDVLVIVMIITVDLTPRTGPLSVLKFMLHSTPNLKEEPGGLQRPGSSTI